MIYEYRCNSCEKTFDVIKPVADYDKPENCSCNSPATRLISGKTMFINASVEHAEFNHGLGCVTRNRQHRAEIAKQRNLIEVGNETADTLLKTANESRARITSYGDI